MSHCTAACGDTQGPGRSPILILLDWSSGFKYTWCHLPRFTPEAEDRPIQPPRVDASADGSGQVARESGDVLASQPRRGSAILSGGTLALRGRWSPLHKGIGLHVNLIQVLQPV